MRTLFATLIGAVTLGATLPAMAGPDFQSLEQARKAHRAQDAQKASPDQRCASKQFVSLPDHGPRAQSTPHLNQLRRQRLNEEIKACKQAMK